MSEAIKVCDQYISAHASIYNADTCEAIVGVPDASVDFSVFSPPFESLFTYSASDRDLGNSHGREQFSDHLSFIAAQQFRTMKSGRMVAIHCMDLPMTLTHHGQIGFVDFPARLREVYERAGFVYYGRITIWKDPVVAQERTHARQLVHHEMIKDSAMSGVGCPDYIVLMRKPGKNEAPVTHTMLCDMSGTRVQSDEQIAKMQKTLQEIADATGRDVEASLMNAHCPKCQRRLEIGEDGMFPEHLVPKDALAMKNDAGKPEHWQRVASPVWAMPESEEEADLRRLAAAIRAGNAPEASRLAGDLAGRYDGSWAKAAPPLPSLVWATANGLWRDGFVDYEDPRAGNPDKRGIDQGDTLNFRSAREDKDERHLCPLQKGAVDRLLDLYTNKGDVVLTPFLGIGTEVVCAVAKGRKGIGFELKASYFRQAVAHVKRVEPGAAGQQTSLLDPGFLINRI